MSLWAFRFLLWYICILFVQPQNRFPFLWSFHIADISIMAAVGCHLVAALQEKRPIIRFGPATVLGLVLLAAGFTSLHMGPLQSSAAWNGYIDMLAKNSLVMILVEAMATSIQRVWAVQTTMVLASLWWVKAGLRLSASGATFAGDRIMGPAVSMIENPNGFAYMMCVLLPAYLYFYQQEHHRRVRLFFLFLALASIFIIFQTGSRTGMMALLAVGVFLLPKYGARYKATLLAVGVAVFVLLQLVGALNLQRFMSIPTSIRAFLAGEIKEETALTQDEQSAQERRIKNTHTWALIREYPIFGVGISPDDGLIPNKYEGARGQVHNEFLMAGREMGLIGMALYSALLGSLFVFGRRVQRHTASWWPQIADLGWTFKMQAVVFVVGGAFSPLPWNPPEMILVGSASALWGCLLQLQRSGSQETTPGP